MAAGSSNIPFRVARNRAPVAPSITRWSQLMVMRMRLRTTTSPSSTTGCVFGGADLRSLYVTSASGRLFDQPLAGGLFAIDVGIVGLSTRRFAG